nr:alpha-amylase family glycosyl hydrolase [uncultured Treponema sp.]
MNQSAMSLLRRIGFLWVVCGLFVCIGGCRKRSGGLELARVAKGAREGVYYSLFVRSFADSDGDGIGDLAGLTQKLDYLNDGSDATDSDLGVTGLWLLPIFPSPSYHGYDVTDYCAINPEYGTMEDFETLIAEADKRGISIILDFPCNHSSTDHPWFAASRDTDDVHRSWYYWLDGEAAAAHFGTSLQKQVWGHPLWNKTDGGYYAGLFDASMPDLNIANPAVRDALKDAAEFWLKKGVAGFRLDAAAHVFNMNKLPVGMEGLSSSLAWWTEFSDFCKSVKPDVYLVAEVWDTASTRAAYMKAIDSNFHFDMGTVIVDALRSGKAGKNNPAKTLYADYLIYKDARADYIDAPFLTNHDQNRLAGMLRGNIPLMKLAASRYILTEGVPFVYYGEEIGMMGGKPDEQLRTPFLWATQQRDSLQTAWIESKYNAKTIPLAEQTGDSTSLVSHYRQLIRLKTGLPALLHGRMEPLDTDSSSVVSYIMRYQNEAAFIAHNLTDTAAEFQLPESVASYRLLYASEPVSVQKGSSIILAPCSSAVCVPEKRPR